jgi:hypothetical protein
MVETVVHEIRSIEFFRNPHLNRGIEAVVPQPPLILMVGREAAGDLAIVLTADLIGPFGSHRRDTL